MGRARVESTSSLRDVLDIRRTRRMAAGLIAAAGVLDLVSALTPPLGARLRLLDGLVPLAVPRTAASLVALAGAALLVLARGVRTGQRRAWGCGLALLAGSAVLHLVKGADVEEAVVAVLVGAWLARRGDAFTAPPSTDFELGWLLAGVAATASASVAAAEVFPRGVAHPAVRAAVVDVAWRLVGLHPGALPDAVDDVMTPVLAAAGLLLVVVGGWVLFRPGHGVHAHDPDRARAIVEAHGGDTLAYFALRDDKQHFFFGQTLVAYALVSGVCLVSPDPVGPRSERAAAWQAFRRFAGARGWTVAVLGATEDWVPTYTDGSMTAMYIGDEAVVDCPSFRLDGGRFKGLRQAVNRIAKRGYTIEFHDPATLDPALRAPLLELLDESRQGPVERGFSMTLGRMFDPRDRGLLLSIAFDASHTPVAFCQWVPSAAVGGYSLDVMRRSRSDEHPNGLTDFVVVRTIEHLAGQGCRGLALNFAVLRSVVSGDSGDGRTEAGKRWLLRKLSDSMQIESLWRYNAKFDPAWTPRYAVYESLGTLVPAAVAAARAESFTELPLVGRFLRPPAAAFSAGGPAGP
jgi:lysylphosphatidylglycerol synthetase-like protein (DUF2156 family)